MATVGPTGEEKGGIVSGVSLDVQGISSFLERDLEREVVADALRLLAADALRLLVADALRLTPWSDEVVGWVGGVGGSREGDVGGLRGGGVGGSREGVGAGV